MYMMNQYICRNVLAGIIAFGVGCGLEEVPDVFASIQYALCFIDYDIKCKHNKDFITHVDYGKYCSMWHPDLVKQLEEAGTIIKIIKTYLKRMKDLESTCKKLDDPSPKKVVSKCNDFIDLRGGLS